MSLEWGSGNGQAHYPHDVRTTMSDSSPPARPIFDPVDTSFDPNDVTGRDAVESPSLSSSNALARFEFEPGKSKDGTKILMVEWEDDDITKSVQGDWEIAWEGKKTVLPAREQSSGDGEGAPVNRLYFLLGPGVNIPTTIKLRKGSVAWKTNPLPAIFSPELGATARQAGKKGVLHTIWAKKRLQVLQREIENESKDNVEGIGLEMAIAEKEWIEQNFGVVTKPSSISMPSGLSGSVTATSPSSPRTPGGGRLMDKLKGLKLGTGAQDLNSYRVDNAQLNSDHNPLSPETADVAVGSFSSFAAIKGVPNPSTLAAKPAQPPSRRMAPQSPPESLASQQRQQAGMGSLNAFATAETESPAKLAVNQKQDDLFALPMSPKSAATTTKSPFPFGPQDTSKYMRSATA